jgi:hypothetical protein
MTGDREQRDVRESLGDLERRLLDLERELRTDASEDATVAAGAPAPPEQRERSAPAAEREPRGGGGVAAPPAPPPDIDPFAIDARAKLAALRETLDGLTSATDRLRETAQTVVEDHGRALVRLERATGAPSSPIVIPSMQAQPAPAVEPEPEPEPIETELAAQSSGGGTVIQPPPELPAFPPLPWLRILAVTVAIAVIGLGFSLLFGGGDSKPAKKPAVPTGVAATDPAITAAGGGISSIPQLRTGAIADVRNDVCRGRIAAGIDVVTPGGTVWTCPGVTQVAAPVIVASGFARKGSKGRTCVSVPAAPALDKLRRNPAATERRDQAVRRASRGSAFAAGSAFDRRNGLTLLAGAPAPGKPCISPTPATLRDGTYPLSTRLILYARAAAAGTPEVRRAAARLKSYFAGTPPLYAIVLR